MLAFTIVYRGCPKLNFLFWIELYTNIPERPIKFDLGHPVVLPHLLDGLIRPAAKQF